MKLDRPFDDGVVQTVNVAVCASSVSANTTNDLIFMLKASLYISDISQTRQQRRVFLTSEGGGRQQSFTQAAPNELKLGEGG